MKQVPYERLAEAVRAGQARFPQARTVRPIYSPSSATSDVLIEVTDRERRGQVYPVVHGRVIA